ncbi:alpha/beta hydrolase [Pelagibacterium xiamenense]|uniref:alpha/beta hydrolase n=1 Tax=Pelagibacterium xiamenense TaxID=2901140 RepID=UPI001E2CD270|nr:dienelactone hydrolase family protein [Pelagibacterium xiamenense]MCD7061384.1 dienelactone hydrolase family protein [Pelagibacterium xiamenense]
MSLDFSLAGKLATAFEASQHPLAFREASVSVSGGVATEALAFETASGEAVRGILTRPEVQVSGGAPAILYVHAHGGNYAIGADELLAGRPALRGPLGVTLAEAGYVSLCIDLPCFGARRGHIESAAAKAALWHGRSLAGQMMGELSSALDYLAGRDDVDAERIGAFGISMGATFAYWLAAIDPRIACVAHLCCYADFETLIALGVHDLHGIYLTVPGLLALAGNGEIAGLIAPRPQLVGIGDTDPLTPPGAVDLALEQTREAYRAAGAEDALELVRSARTGHVETPRMRDAVLAFFARHLRP